MNEAFIVLELPIVTTINFIITKNSPDLKLSNKIHFF